MTAPGDFTFQRAPQLSLVVCVLSLNATALIFARIKPLYPQKACKALTWDLETHSSGHARSDNIFCNVQEHNPMTAMIACLAPWPIGGSMQLGMLGLLVELARGVRLKGIDHVEFSC